MFDWVCCVGSSEPRSASGERSGTDVELSNVARIVTAIVVMVATLMAVSTEVKIARDQRLVVQSLFDVFCGPLDTVRYHAPAFYLDVEWTFVGYENRPSEKYRSIQGQEIDSDDRPYG